MKYDHAQLLIAMDTFTLPTPPPPQPGGSRPQRQVFDHVLFESQLPKWKRAVQTLLEPTPEEGEPTSGQAIFERNQSDCQRMLGAALSLQSRAQAARRRAHERPADRSKAQCIALKDIQLYTCALKETVEPQNWSSADLPLATRRALQRLGLQGFTVLQAKLLRVLPLWRRRIHQALEQSRDTLAVLSESQRKEAEKSLRRRFHWLFENGIKGIQRILGKRKPQKAMAYVTQHCPCGLQWRREDSRSTSTLHIWARKAAPWLDTSRYTIQVDQSHVSIKVLVLTDLYPLIQCACGILLLQMEGPLHLSTGRDRGPATTSVPLWNSFSRVTPITPKRRVTNADIRGASQFHFGSTTYLQFNRYLARRRWIPGEKKSGDTARYWTPLRKRNQ